MQQVLCCGVCQHCYTGKSAAALKQAAFDIFKKHLWPDLRVVQPAHDVPC